MFDFATHGSRNQCILLAKDLFYCKNTLENYHQRENTFQFEFSKILPKIVLGITRLTYWTYRLYLQPIYIITVYSNTNDAYKDMISSLKQVRFPIQKYIVAKHQQFFLVVHSCSQCQMCYVNSVQYNILYRTEGGYFHRRTGANRILYI